MSKTLNFNKYEALGNDYIVINPRDVDAPLSDNTIAAICDRHFGLGGDGILLGPDSKEPPFKLTIYNADGSTAEKSGNGLRIFAKYLVDEGYAPEPDFQLQVNDAIIDAHRIDEHANHFRINMGIPNFNTPLNLDGTLKEYCIIDECIEFEEGLQLSASVVSMGNPHCVIRDTGFSLEQIKTYGALIERHPMFPNRTNVQFLKVDNRQQIVIHIWERGSEYTLSSGSSSCAAASVARRLGLVDDEVKVMMPGGEIELVFDELGSVHMSGPVHHIAHGRVSADFLSRKSSTSPQAP